MSVSAPVLGPSLAHKPPPSRIHRATVGVVVLVFGALWLFEGHYLVTAWFPPLFDDLTPINGVAAGAFMTLMLACSIAVFVRPRTTLGPFRLLVVGTALLAGLLPLAFLRSAPLVTLGLSIGGYGLLAGMALSHPGRDRLLPSLALNRPMIIAGLMFVIPFAPIGIEMLVNQLTLDDEIAQRWFYGGYSLYLSTIAAYALIAAVHRDTRILFAAAATTLAAILGMVSIVYPGAIHSLGVLGGGLVLVWAVGFAALTWAVSRTPDR